MLPFYLSNPSSQNPILVPVGLSHSYRQTPVSPQTSLAPETSRAPSFTPFLICGHILSPLLIVVDLCLTLGVSRPTGRAICPVHHPHLVCLSGPPPVSPLSPLQLCHSVAPSPPLSARRPPRAPIQSQACPAPTRGTPGGRRSGPRPHGPVPPAPAARSHGWKEEPRLQI